MNKLAWPDERGRIILGEYPVGRNEYTLEGAEQLLVDLSVAIREAKSLLDYDAEFEAYWKTLPTMGGRDEDRIPGARLGCAAVGKREAFLIWKAAQNWKAAQEDKKERSNQTQPL